jgi:RNA polymerase sigma factor (sigma-70 family)
MKLISNLKDFTDNNLVSVIVNTSDPIEKRRLQGMLYDRIIEQVYRKCLYMVKNKEIAKDLSHDIIVKVLLRLNTFRGDSPFYQWVSAIIFNNCVSYLEKEKKIKLVEIDLVHNNLTDDQLELELKYLKEKEINCLQIVMEKITPHEKALMVMRYYDEMPVKNIAATLNISESATKMRLMRIRDSLSKLIEEEDCG